MTLETPLILTLKLDEAAFASLDALRVRHFPRERNFIPAHVTLFHALPGSRAVSVRETLRDLASQTEAARVFFSKLRFLGRGVAVEVDSPDLVRLRGVLAREWDGWLGAQDKQGYRPHITIQNKVAATAARLLYQDLTASWQPFAGCGEALLLWQYLGGPWRLLDEFHFNRLHTE